MNVLAHSFKGTEWKKHKYLRKEDGRYIYKEVVKSIDDEVDFMNEKIEELEELKSHHQKAMNEAIENGDLKAAEAYSDYIENINTQISDLETQRDSLIKLRNPSKMSPGDATRAIHADMLLDDDSLTHWGILGMKWGVRRYQNDDGSLTNAGRKRYGVKGERKQETPEEREEKKQKAVTSGTAKDVLKYKGELSNQDLNNAINRIRNEKALKDLADADKTPTLSDYEQEKERAIKSGTASDVLKFKGDLTNQQLNDALNRIRMEQQLSDLQPKIKTGLEKAQEIMDTAGKVRNMAETGINVYNTYAKIHNTFSPPGSEIPIIGEKKEKPDKAKEAALKSGDPKQLLKYKGKLDQKEIGDAYKIMNNWKLISKEKEDREAKAKEEKEAKAAAKQEAREQKIKDKEFAKRMKEENARVKSDAKQNIQNYEYASVRDDDASKKFVSDLFAMWDERDKAQNKFLKEQDKKKK